MSLGKQVLSSVFLVLPLLMGSCANLPLAEASPPGCIKPFEAFAFSGPKLNENAKVETVLPSPPWKMEARVPTGQIEGYRVLSINAEVARSVGGDQEIWLIERLTPLETGESDTNAFAVYQPKFQKWRFIPAKIENTNFFVGRLFVTSDGNLWGTTIWDTVHGEPELERVPVLSRFNENTQRFEFAEGVLEIPWRLHSYNFFPWPEVVLDDWGAFWIFAKEDALYRYDPAMQVTQKQVDLPNLNITQTALAPDGSIYFEIYSEKIHSNDSFFRLSDGMLFQFSPETKTVVPLDIPDKPWPTFSGMLVDRSNTLWLGAIGYRDKGGNWHLIHPNIEQYLASAGDAYMSAPSLMLESSDGILWYRKFLDDRRADGTAWYDPQTGKGCMFTNVSANVIEGVERQLWLVADGKLFKYRSAP